MGISKTDFMRGMQCPKMLWLDAHKKEERRIPPETQQLLDRGNEFGDEAMGLFGEFEEMTVLIPGTDFPNKYAMAKRTAEALAAGTENICEATFFYKKCSCAADIIHKTQTGYELYEVKNSPSVREKFVEDAGFQLYIIEGSGLKIDRVFIVYHGDEEAGEARFVPEDVTERAREYSSLVKENLDRLCGVKAQGEEPVIACGEQCDKPYGCWYKEYCGG